MPPVSALLPVRDAAATLRTAIESIRTQTFPDWEMLLIDDGCRDGSRAIMEAAAAEDPRIRVIGAPEPGGIVAALTAGIGHSRAPLIARMDADDVSRPTRFARQVAFLDEHPEIAVVGCRVRIHRGGQPPLEGQRRYERWLNALTTPEAIRRERFIESPIAHPTAMMRRGALEAVGGYRDTRWAEDHDLWLRMLSAGMRLAKVPEVLLDWSDAPDRLSRRDARYAQAQFLACKAHHLAREPRVRRHGVVIWAAGPIGKRMARLLRAEGVAVHHFVDIHPRRVGEVIHGARVVGPDAEAGGDRAMHLAAAGQPGRREAVRALLRGLGKVEGEDFLCVA